jgi:hypothetical protein
MFVERARDLALDGSASGEILQPSRSDPWPKQKSHPLPARRLLPSVESPPAGLVEGDGPKLLQEI